jgi:hypothetical protein
MSIGLIHWSEGQSLDLVGVVMVVQLDSDRERSCFAANLYQSHSCLNWAAFVALVAFGFGICDLDPADSELAVDCKVHNVGIGPPGRLVKRHNAYTGAVALRQKGDRWQTYKNNLQ